MDEQQQKELQRQRRLEAERQKLTEEQRQQHDHFCEALKANEAYKTEYAIKAAEIIRTEEGIRQAKALQYLSQRADQQGIIDQRKDFAEADKQKELQAQKAEEAQAERARDAEKQQRQEQEKQARERHEREAKELAAQEAAKREPVPSVMQRFSVLLAESRAQKEAQTHAADIERAGQFADTRPNYARHDVLKNPQEPSTIQANASSAKDAERPTPRGEISDAKAERLARVFNNPSRDKDFDPTHDPTNSRNFAPGRGGRGGR
jgi:colicin import membrane protein